jgi:hypothetical protein
MSHPSTTAEWRLVWNDSGEWLLCEAGPWRVVVADIEGPYSGDDSAKLCLHRWAAWGHQDAGSAHLQFELERPGGCDRDTDADILCRSMDEARAICCAMLAVRGIAVPKFGGAP